MVTKIKSVLGVCALGVCALGSSTAFAVCPDPSAYPMNGSNGCSLPGLVDGSFPYFEQSVYVTLNNRKNGGFSLNASYTGGANDTSLFFVNNTDVPYQIDNTFYQLRAKYNSKKEELTGTIRIMGKLGSNAQETLMTADLKGEWAIDGTLLGFNTMNIQCGPSITALVTCTNAEVAYLSLDSALYPGGDKGRTSTMGLAVTSVPVPAAAWLLGSGLVGFAGVARRKRLTT